VVAELAAELVAAPLDLDVLAELIAIALVAAVVARSPPGMPSSTVAIALVAAVVQLARRPGGGRRARRGAGRHAARSR
jgi:hypothetical protein